MSSKESAPNTPNTGYWRRHGALIGLLAVTGQAAGLAEANAAAAAASGENTPAAIDTAPNPREANARVAKQMHQSKEALEAIFKSEKPHMFYGAAVITGKKSVNVYVTPDKNPRDRILVPLGNGKIIIRDFLEATIDGDQYFIAYDRGPEGQGRPSDKDGATDPKDLARFRYIPLNEVKKVDYYAHHLTKPGMVNTYVAGGQVGIKGEVPLFNNPMDIEYAFSQYRPLANFIEDNGLVPLGKNYKPPFER